MTARGAEILVVGEALVDIVGGVETPGGSPANVALGLGRLGRAVRMHTAIGADARGRRIAAHLEASGVTLDPRSWTSERTSTAAAAIGADGAAEYTFDLDTRLAPPDLGAAGVVHVGSISMFLEPGAGVIAGFLETLPSEVRITVDPNIRPRLLSDHADAVAVFEAVARRADLVKMSDEDAEWLYPSLSAAAVLEHVISLGASVAAVTRGGQGADLASSAERVHVAADPVVVVDTIGAGDTFMAALIDGIHDPEGGPAQATAATLRALGARAARAAAFTASRRGADLPWSRDLSVPTGG